MDFRHGSGVLWDMIYEVWTRRGAEPSLSWLAGSFSGGGLFLFLPASGEDLGLVGFCTDLGYLGNRNAYGDKYDIARERERER